MEYSDYKYFRIRFDSGVAFVSINHPPINLLDEALSLELDKLGREALKAGAETYEGELELEFLSRLSPKR
jgi:hypothetical protein